MLSDAEIKALLATARTIAVVGLSDNPKRDSYEVARYLQHAGYQIIPVNPNLSGMILGAEPYPSLRDLPGPVDIVDVFRRSEFVPEIVDQAVALGARAVWLQLGVSHPEAVERARAAGLPVVQNRCIKVEHRRLMHERIFPYG